MTKEPKPPAASKAILILSFDTPWPVDYGGIYDVIGRAHEFQRAGYAVDYVGVTLDTRRLKDYSIGHAEPRSPFRRVYILRGYLRPWSVLTTTPASASARNVDIPLELRNYLLSQTYAFVLVDHIKMVPFAGTISRALNMDYRLRMHNDEVEYYASVARRETRRLRAATLWLESLKYRFYQKKVLRRKLFSCVYYISPRDMQKFFGISEARQAVLPVVADFSLGRLRPVDDALGAIDFLYVANLELEENVQGLLCALQFLHSNGIQRHSLLVCGRCRSAERRTAIVKTFAFHEFCEIRFNVSPAELDAAYAKAKFFLNFAVSSGGIKTKLIDALARGIVVITNELGIQGSGLDAACIIASRSTAPVIQKALTNRTEYQKLKAQVTDALREYEEFVRSTYKNEFAIE